MMDERVKFVARLLEGEKIRVVARPLFIAMQEKLPATHGQGLGVQPVS